jgi:hypothetical protein
MNPLLMCRNFRSIECHQKHTTKSRETISLNTELVVQCSVNIRRNSKIYNIPVKSVLFWLYSIYTVHSIHTVCYVTIQYVHFLQFKLYMCTM